MLPNIDTAAWRGIRRDIRRDMQKPIILLIPPARTLDMRPSDRSPVVATAGARNTRRELPRARERRGRGSRWSPWSFVGCWTPEALHTHARHPGERRDPRFLAKHVDPGLRRGDGIGAGAARGSACIQCMGTLPKSTSSRSTISVRVGHRFVSCFSSLRRLGRRCLRRVEPSRWQRLGDATGRSLPGL